MKDNEKKLQPTKSQDILQISNSRKDFSILCKYQLRCQRTNQICIWIVTRIKYANVYLDGIFTKRTLTKQGVNKAKDLYYSVATKKSSISYGAIACLIEDIPIEKATAVAEGLLVIWNELTNLNK